MIPVKAKSSIEGVDVKVLSVELNFRWEKCAATIEYGFTERIRWNPDAILHVSNFIRETQNIHKHKSGI